MKLREFKCKKSYYDNVDPCKPRNLLNKFYWNENDHCTENMHGTTILSLDSNCSWYDSKTNKAVKTDLHPNSFIHNNRHHKPDEQKKIYIWKSTKKNKTKSTKESTKKSTKNSTKKSIKKSTKKSTKKYVPKKSTK